MHDFLQQMAWLSLVKSVRYSFADPEEDEKSDLLKK
jgi:hypothetical protein